MKGFLKSEPVKIIKTPVEFVQVADMHLLTQAVLDAQQAGIEGPIVLVLKGKEGSSGATIFKQAEARKLIEKPKAKKVTKK